MTDARLPERLVRPDKAERRPGGSGVPDDALGGGITASIAAGQHQDRER